MAKLSHEKMMEISWKLIHDLGITDDRSVYETDPNNHYLVEDIHKVRDAFYNDLENDINIEDEWVTGLFDRYGIKYQ